MEKLDFEIEMAILNRTKQKNRRVRNNKKLMQHIKNNNYELPKESLISAYDSLIASL